jgi:hypothetical protein
LQCAAISADAAGRRRPKPRDCASFAKIAHLRFRVSRRSVSVRVSDQLDGIAYPNAAAVVAANDLDVLRCHAPARGRIGATKGGTAHLLSVQNREARDTGSTSPSPAAIRYPLSL